VVQVDSVADEVVVEGIFQQALLIKCLVHFPEKSFSNGPEMGAFMHSCEGDMLYESTNTKIPYFNAPIYLENKVPDPPSFLQQLC
jgi:hypothetical protein